MGEVVPGFVTNLDESGECETDCEDERPEVTPKRGEDGICVKIEVSSLGSTLGTIDGRRLRESISQRHRGQFSNCIEQVSQKPLCRHGNSSMTEVKSQQI